MHLFLVFLFNEKQKASLYVVNLSLNLTRMTENPNGIDSSVAVDIQATIDSVNALVRP